MSLVGFGLCCLLVSSAHAESRPLYGKSLVASLLEEPVVVDPVLARTHTDLTVVSLFFDTLYIVREGKVMPHLAASLPDTSDPLRVVVALRDGVAFHDGVALRAEDVVSSLERLRKSDMGFLLEGVKRIRVVPPSASSPGLRVELILRSADPALARRLSGLHTSIAKESVKPSWRRIAGTGAWKLRKRSVRDRVLSLRANDAHFAGRPFLDSLSLRWHVTADAEARDYEAGMAHLSSRGSIAFAGHRPKYATANRQADLHILSYVGFGCANPLYREAAFRRAISLAIGRSGMRQIGSGERVFPTTTVLPPKRAPRAFALRSNPRASRSLLAGLSTRYPQLESKTLSLQLLVNESRPDDAVSAARVAAGLFELGIATRIVSLRGDEFHRRIRSDDCDLFIGQLAPGGGLLTTSGAAGLTFLRKAFAIAGHVKDAKKYFREGRAELERNFAKAMPLVPLFHRSLRVHYRSNVEGLRFTGARTLDYPGIFIHGDPVKN